MTITAFPISSILASGQGVYGRNSAGYGPGELLSASDARDLVELGTAYTPQFTALNLKGQAVLTSPSAGTISATTNGTTLGTLQAATIDNPTARLALGNATHGINSTGTVFLQSGGDYVGNASGFNQLSNIRSNQIYFGGFAEFLKKNGTAIQSNVKLEAPTFTAAGTAQTTVGNATGGVLSNGVLSWEAANKQRLNSGAWQSYESSLTAWQTGFSQEASASGIKTSVNGATPVVQAAAITDSAVDLTELTSRFNSLKAACAAFGIIAS